MNQEISVTLLATHIAEQNQTPEGKKTFSIKETAWNASI
jgi:hypothetical protein